MLEQYIAIKVTVDLVIIQYLNKFKNIISFDDEISFIKELIEVLL